MAKKIITEDALRIKAIFEAAIDGIITIDSRASIESANHAARQLFGYTEEELIGQNVKILMPNPYQEEHDKYVSDYVATRKAKIIGKGREVRGKRKDGSIFPMRLAVSEVLLDDRSVFTGIVHDLSQVKTAEEKVIKLNAELEEKVRFRTEELSNVVNQLLETNQVLETEISERQKIEEALRQTEGEIREMLEKEKELSELKSRFVSMASHEFRTPLSTILSSASLIGRYPNTDQQDRRDKHINRIKSAVSNLTGILNDFLSLSKLEEGKVSNSPTDFIFADFIAEIIEETEALLKKEQHFEIDNQGIEVEVNLDKKVLKNILLNLISNAIKYSSEGKAIYIQTLISNEILTITIRDEGIGIPESEQHHLFDRFFRASNVTNIQGTGLGLHIVKNYVEMIGGSLSFSSKHNQGSTFTVIIPLKPYG